MIKITPIDNNSDWELIGSKEVVPVNDFYDMLLDAAKEYGGSSIRDYCKETFGENYAAFLNSFIYQIVTSYVDCEDVSLDMLDWICDCSIITEFVDWDDEKLRRMIFDDDFNEYRWF